MSISLTRNTIARLQRDMSDLRTKDAAEARKEADLAGKFNRAMEGATRASSASTQSSKLRDAERAQSDLAAVARRRADLSRSMATKTSDLTREQDRLSREEDQERKKVSAMEKKLKADRDGQIAKLDRRLRQQRGQESAFFAPIALPRIPSQERRHDVFISHASEDKEDFVRDLATRLRAAGVDVWYDEFTVDWGDSLRRKIDEGLADSRFGIVVLSTAFFAKEWPQKELDGLFQLEASGQSRILPIWHKISKDEVAAFSPMLADKVALNTALLTVDEIVARLVAYCREAVGSDS